MLYDLPFATEDEFEELMQSERILANPDPCQCDCDCVGIVTTEGDTECLACQHGFHTEDE